MDDPQLHEHARGERLIAGTRVVLAAFALIVLLIDPDLTRESPDRFLLMGGTFALYAALLAVLARRPAMARRTPRLILQLSDFLFFSALIFRTHASVSPFFIFFLFSLVTALLRFGVPEMIFTSVAAMYVVMALADENIRGDPGYLVMRSISLALATLLLARLGTPTRGSAASSRSSPPGHAFPVGSATKWYARSSSLLAICCRSSGSCSAGTRRRSHGSTSPCSGRTRW